MWLVSFFSLAIALSACSGDKQGKPSLITIGIPQDIEDSLDPNDMVAAGTKEIFFNVFEGLVKPDSDGNIVPAVASEINVSDDGLTYTFTLREGVKFHDGTFVTVDDIIYSVNKCAGLNGNTSITAFSDVKEIVAVDDSHVAITLNNPNNNFLSSIATVECAIIPEHNENPDNNCIGTGPYMFVSRTPLENIVMTKFEDYYGECGNVTDIEFKICDNADTIAMMLDAGTIDMFSRLTDAQLAEITSDDYEILEGTMNLVQALYLNNDFEPFKDVRVRKALCYAVDRQALLDMISGGDGVIIGSSIYPSFGKYYDESLAKAYEPDVAKAKELLKEAGYENGLSFTITVPSNYQQHVDTATVLAEQLKAAGINATINQVDWDTWLSEVYAGRNYEATVIGVDAATLTADALLDRFASDAPNNFVNFNSAAYDTALANAVAELDDEKQTAYYKECAKILSDEAANVYIQDLPEYVAINKKFTGYKFYPMYIMDISTLNCTED